MLTRRRRLPYYLTLLTGAGLGFFYGEMAFPAIEDLIGDPYCDIIMGAGGAALAGIGYEIATSFSRAV